MYSEGVGIESNGPSCDDYETRISKLTKMLNAMEELRDAMEKVKLLRGTPNSNEVPFMAIYGNACMESNRLKKDIDNLVARQEKEAIELEKKFNASKKNNLIRKTGKDA